MRKRTGKFLAVVLVMAVLFTLTATPAPAVLAGAADTGLPAAYGPAEEGGETPPDAGAPPEETIAPDAGQETEPSGPPEAAPEEGTGDIETTPEEGAEAAPEEGAALAGDIEAGVQAAEDVVPLVVTVNGVETTGGGYAPGLTIEITADPSASVTAIYFTADGSDPTAPGAGTQYMGAILMADINLRAAAEVSGVRKETNVDYIFSVAQNGTTYTTFANLADVKPNLFSATPEMKQNTYRFDDAANLGVSTEGDGWEHKSYIPDSGLYRLDDGSPSGIMGTERSYGGGYIMYNGTEDGDELKSDRLMLRDPNVEEQIALSFLLWTDDSYAHTDGIQIKLYGPGGAEEELPIYFSTRNTDNYSQTGWQRCFVDLSGHMSGDDNGYYRTGFGIVGVGNKPIYIDEVGVTRMSVKRVKVIEPFGMSSGMINYGDKVGLSNESADVSAIFSKAPQPVQVQPKGLDETPPSANPDVACESGEPTTYYYRAQTGSNPPTLSGAIGAVKIPSIMSRTPVLYEYDGATGTRGQAVITYNISTHHEYPVGSKFEISNDDIERYGTGGTESGGPYLETRIYYTTDGTAPVDENGKTANAVEVNATAGTPIILTYPGGKWRLRISAISTIKNGSKMLMGSGIVTTIVESPAAAVTSDVPSGTVEKGTEVTLSCTTPNAKIYYNTDGSTPTKEHPGTLYTGPIVIEEDTAIIAVAWAADTREGPASTFKYTMAAEGGDIFEPNNATGDATPLSFPFEIHATLHDIADLDYYAFDFPGGRLELNFEQPHITGIMDTPHTITLLKEDGSTVVGGEGTTDQYIGINNLEAGRYYALVKGANGAHPSIFGSTEYTLTASKLSDTAINFSEQNMVTAMNHPDEPASYSRPEGLNAGGNYAGSTAYLSRWSGPVLEEQDPYNVVKITDPNDPDGKIFDNDAMPYTPIKPSYHLKDAVWLSLPTDQAATDALKAAVYTHGAVQISYDHSSKAMDESVPEKTHFYYPPTLAGKISDGGHAVALVGWDDNYPKADLAVTIDGITYTPNNDGAWIVKNSWGEDFGAAGYFYASYESCSFIYQPPTYFVLESNVNYNTVYQYDLLGAISRTPMYNQGNQSYAYMKNVFEAEADETLRAVGFYTVGTEQQYDIYLETRGERTHIAGGFMAETGYHTLRLASEYYLAAGDEFAIIVRLETTDGSTLEMPLELKSAGLSDKVKLMTGYTFCSADGANWEDTAKDEFSPGNMCIKAFTYNGALAQNAVAYAGTPLPEGTGASVQSGTVVNSYTEEESQSLGNIASALDDLEISTPQAGTLSLPAAFDLRAINAVSAVEDQNPLGSCWTFGAYASVESVLMRAGNMAYAYPLTVTLNKSDEQINIAGGKKAFSLAATVSAPDKIGTNLVYWSFEGDLDAIEILERTSESGTEVPLVNAISPGTVTITATSAADTLKSVSMTLTITENYIPGLDDLALVHLPAFTPTDGKLDDSDWTTIINAMGDIMDGQALVVPFKGEVLIPKAVFEALASKGIKVAFVQLDAKDQPHINVVYDGKTITNPKDYMLGAKYEYSAGEEALIKTAFPAGTATFPVNYTHSGEMPGPAVISLLASKAAFAVPASLHYYGYGGGAFTLVDGVNASFDKEFIRLDGVKSCSEYLITNQPKISGGGPTPPTPPSNAATVATAGRAKTGDTTNLPLLIVIVAAALAGIAGALVWRRRKLKQGR